MLSEKPRTFGHLVEGIREGYYLVKLKIVELCGAYAFAVRILLLLNTGFCERSVEKQKFYEFKQYISEMLSSKLSVWSPSRDTAQQCTTFVEQCIVKSRDCLAEALDFESKAQIFNDHFVLHCTTIDTKCQLPDPVLYNAPPITEFQI